MFMSIAVTHIIAIDELVSDRDTGGGHMATQFGHLLRGLVINGVKVELVALVADNPGIAIETYLSDLERSQITIVRVSLNPGVDRATASAPLRRLLRDRRENIIHTHLATGSSVGRMAAVLSFCPHIIDTWHNQKPVSGFEYLRTHFLNLFTEYSIAVSTQVYLYLIDRLSFNPLKTQIIRYGIKSPEVLIPRDVARAELGLPVADFCIGYVGSLGRIKNIPLLFEAIEKMDGVSLCIIGRGDEEANLRQRVRDFNLDNVTFLNMGDRAIDLMTGFDLFVLPSRSEESGHQLLEAMIRNVPVAGTTNGIIPEILANGDRGFLFNTAKDLRSIIERLMADPSWSDSRVSTAYRDIMGEYTIHAMIDKTRRLYQTLAHSA